MDASNPSPTPHRYDREFYDVQSSNSIQSARKVLPYVMTLLGPKSVVDVGCGIGTWLAAFRELGVSDVLGVDGDYVQRSQLLIPAECFVPRDLSKPLALTRTFDLAMSLEVAEHLPSASASLFVESLTRLAPVVLFSAAVPGQGGTHHINEQWPDYWKKLFENCGYELVDPLRRRFWDDAEVGACYRQNMLIYVRKEKSSQYGAVYDAGRQMQMPLAVVHPQQFENSLAAHPQTLCPLLCALPKAFLRLLLGAFPRPLRLAISKRFGSLKRDASGKGGNQG